MLIGMRAAIGCIITVIGGLLLEDNSSLLMEDNSSKLLGEG